MFWLIVGTRPNIVKALPVYDALKIFGLETILIHTGQHYDPKLSTDFFHEMGVDSPDINLDIPKKLPACEQITVIISSLTSLYKTSFSIKPDISPKAIVVFGDVTSSLAAAIFANKNGIRLCHVESGLRSFDKTMPEEMNRILIDNMANDLFVTEISGVNNLHNENIHMNKNTNIHYVGNTMIDSLFKYRRIANKMSPIANPYILVTLHRPSNVDDPSRLNDILSFLAKTYYCVFPVHPRTKKNISAEITRNENISFKDPVGYIEFMSLMMHAKCVITDSGGIQEETTVLNVPCITLRPNTERPVTVTEGTNTVFDYEKEKENELSELIKNKIADKRIAKPLIWKWDGEAAYRIAEIMRFFK